MSLIQDSDGVIANTAVDADAELLDPPTELSYKLRALIRQRHRCCWCGDPLTLEEATREHIVPQALGGNMTFANTAVAHAECNNDRGHDLSREPYPSPVFNFMRVILRSARRTPPILSSHSTVQLERLPIPNEGNSRRRNRPFTSNWLRDQGYLMRNFPTSQSAPPTRAQKLVGRFLSTGPLKAPGRRNT
jgi:hypothetical protein